MSLPSSIAFCFDSKGSFTARTNPFELYVNVYPAIPVVGWYAFENPPSITINFPFALTGLSPSLTFTGICPFIICPSYISAPNFSKILLHIFSSSTLE